ncbi:hypothetical protein BGX38DRAFT_1140065 [Terfezia claveryi]|nr:hypothetical protein BGX38DRAFT_1140065 [Terfezia claveryi]
MRGKRAKQYKKLMNAYAHTFGFRSPYQMELVRGLPSRDVITLAPSDTFTPPHYPQQVQHITSSSSSNPPTLAQTQKDAAISLAETFERRCCGHHTLSNPSVNLSLTSAAINRSVMIIEPMADVSWERREKEE